MGIAQDLVVAARRWRTVRASGDAVAPSVAVESERAELRRWLEGFGRSETIEQVRQTRVLEMEASQVPWVDTGIELFEGDWVTTLAAGRAILSDALDVWVGPQLQLWMRIGERGVIFNGTRDTYTFRAETAGRLYIGNGFPGQWGDMHGRVSTPLDQYDNAKGGLTVVVIHWNEDAARGLAEATDERLAPEAHRLRDHVEPPKGWEYLWFLGRSEIFREATDAGRPCIQCNTHRNVAILQHDAAFALDPGTTLRWSWKVDELPSALPENTAASHDYLSVAVEFENGRDITYTWSPELAAGTGYWCPLPNWKDREFHVVVRCGSTGLGTWLDESRDLHADYRKYMGEPPQRIVRVWLIAVSLFQRRTGRASFRDFMLEAADGSQLQIGG
jgi:hypothetical protein